MHGHTYTKTQQTYRNYTTLGNKVYTNDIQKMATPMNLITKKAFPPYLYNINKTTAQCDTSYER